MRNASGLASTGGYCAGDIVRFQIMRGRLWVDFKTDRSDEGWYPARVSARQLQLLWQGRVCPRGLLPVALRSLPAAVPHEILRP